MNHIQQKRQQKARATIKQLKETVPSVLKDYPVMVAYLYGSVARQHPLPTSDIDIAVLLSDPPETGQALLQLEFALQTALETATGLSQFDVRAINHAPLMVRGEVVQRGILLYERDKTSRVAFEVLTRKLYFDYRPQAERMQQALLKHLQQHGLSYGKSNRRHRLT